MQKPVPGRAAFVHSSGHSPSVFDALPPLLESALRIGDPLDPPGGRLGRIPRAWRFPHENRVARALVVLVADTPPGQSKEPVLERASLRVGLELGQVLEDGGERILHGLFRLLMGQPASDGQIVQQGTVGGVELLPGLFVTPGLQASHQAPPCPGGPAGRSPGQEGGRHGRYNDYTGREDGIFRGREEFRKNSGAVTVLPNSAAARSRVGCWTGKGARPGRKADADKSPRLQHL